MKKSHFTLLGVPVRIEFGFLLVALLALSSRDAAGAAVWVAAVFLGVLVHEFGHAFAMRRVGRTPFITLHGLGGLTEGHGSTPLTPRQDFFISIAGPVTGLLLGGFIALVGSLISSADPLVELFVRDSIWINVAWSFVNLLPLVPWDGGHVFDAGLRWATGRAWPRLVGVVAIVGGVGVIIAAFVSKQILLGYFGLMSIIAGARKISDDQKSKRDAALWTRLMNGEDVEPQLRELIADTLDPAEKAGHYERLAWLYLLRRDFVRARQSVTAMGEFTASRSLRARLAAANDDSKQVVELLNAQPDAADLPLLASALISLGRFDELSMVGAELAADRLFRAGEYERSLEYCTQLLAQTKDGRHAYNQACCFAKLGRADEAVAALQTAASLGYDVRELRTDDDLSSLREHPQIVALLNSCAR